MMKNKGRRQTLVFVYGCSKVVLATSTRALRLDKALNLYTEDTDNTVSSVSVDSPLFDVSGTVKNNSDSVLSRISARIFVYDSHGKLVGAAEASAWDVAPGATASFNGSGIGQAPAGPVNYEVTALGVSY